MSAPDIDSTAAVRTAIESRLDDCFYMANLASGRLVDTLTYRPDAVDAKPHCYLIGPEDLDAMVWAVLHLQGMITDLRRDAPEIIDPRAPSA